MQRRGPAAYSASGVANNNLSESFQYQGGELAQVTTSGSQNTTDTYVYRRDGTPLELIRTQSGATHTYWYEVDGRGNVIALTDSTGNTVDRYAYDLWGKPITVSESVPQRLRYTGSWYDVELGWYWLTTRAYDPVLGRFLQPDPSQQEGIFTYVYSGDDPVDYNDKSGMDPASDAMQSACADDPTSGACMAAIAAQRAAYYASTVFAAPAPTTGSSAGLVDTSANAIQTGSGGGAQPPTTSTAPVTIAQSAPLVATTSAPLSATAPGAPSTGQPIRSQVSVVFVPADPSPCICQHAVIVFADINRISAAGNTGYSTEGVGAGPRVLGIYPAELVGRAPTALNFEDRFYGGVADYCSSLPYPDAEGCNFTYDTISYYTSQSVSQLKASFDAFATCVNGSSVSYNAIGDNSNRYAYTALEYAGIRPGATPSMVDAPGWGTTLTGLTCPQKR